MYKVVIKIETSKILRRNLILHLACAALIIVAFFTNRALVFVSAIVATGYIFSNVSWDKKFSLFMFLLSFSPIFKYTGIDTSLFMFLRIAIVISYTVQKQEKINHSFVFIAIAFFAYCAIVSEICETDYLISAINLILWIMIGYILIHTISLDNSTSVIKGLSNGVLITGFIGLFLENIPQLYEEANVLMTIAEDGAYVSRYAGFWGDPNFFSVMIIASMWFTYNEFNNNRVKVVDFLLRCAAASFLGLMTLSKSCIILMIVFWLYVLIAKNNIKTAPKVGLFFALIIAVVIFVWKNPYWFSDIMYRFTGSEDDVSVNTLTTGRFEIWESYVDKIMSDISWIFGNGLNKANFENKAMHNILIQAIYYIGVVGLALYISLIVSVYKSAKTSFRAERQNSPAKYALISLFVTLLFLDGFLIEQYYSMFSLAFVYLLGLRSSEENLISHEESVV